MGIALVLEGFMSSFYHICPTDANFQFGELYVAAAIHCKTDFYYFLQLMPGPKATDNSSIRILSALRTEAQ